MLNRPMTTLHAQGEGKASAYVKRRLYRDDDPWFQLGWTDAEADACSLTGVETDDQLHRWEAGRDAFQMHEDAERC